MSRGIIIVLSGFSGAGKGTVVKRILNDYSDYALSISATTRKPREGEKDGVHYFFKTREEFEEMIENHQLIEHAEYVGNYYGTPLEYVNDQLDAGKNVLLEIETKGALQVKEQFPETTLIFMTPPTAKELKRRLVKRGTETEEVIKDRLEKAVLEAEVMDQYDYILVNDDLDVCVKEFDEIVRAVKKEKARQLGFISEMKADLKTSFGN